MAKLYPNKSMALGSVPIDTGSAIYLALEDTFRRLQRRVSPMLNGARPSDKLHLFTEWPRMPEGLVLLDVEMRKHPDLRLVVIDTYAKFKPLETSRTNLIMIPIISIWPTSRPWQISMVLPF
jgi:hypothetical protein